MIKRSRSSIIAVFLICAAVLSGIPAFAQSDMASGTVSSVSAGITTVDNKHYLEEAVIKLMEEGKLSKEKAEKILEYRKKKLNELSKQDKMNKEQLGKQRKKGSLLRDLVHDGIITEAEGEAIKAKLKEMKETRFQVGLQQLVDKGVLSGQDIDNIRSYMLKEREARKAQMDKLRTMTPEERKAYFESAKKDRKDIISKMVEDKVITEKQAEEIRKAVPELDRQKGRKSH